MLREGHLDGGPRNSVWVARFSWDENDDEHFETLRKLSRSRVAKELSRFVALRKKLEDSAL
jgi:hypothetical protein